MTKTDTIAAVSTPVGMGGIGIIRISGPEAVEIADKIFFAGDKKPLRDAKTHTMHYGHIKDTEGENVDEVMASVMLSPRSFTAEDTVEISTHGSPAALERVLSLAVDAGARLAEPGEFTKRAFLNGRIDLSRAEAVIDVIHADSAVSLKSAVAALDGGIYKRIEEIREPLLYACAQQAAAVDYPDDEIAELTEEGLRQILVKASADCERLINTSSDGRIAKEGILLVIAGKPNVGKSSLMNALLEADRAIVTDVKGTTRDVIEEKIIIGGVLVRLFDTAGLRNTEDEVEKIGVKKTKDYIAAADVAVVMIDSSLPVEKEDADVFDATSGKKRIVVLNKSDLEVCTDSEDIARFLSPGDRVVKISAKCESGIDDLKNAICEVCRIGKISASQTMISNMRHLCALKEAKEAIDGALFSLDSKMPMDMCAIDINAALEKLGLITGLTVSADIVEKIFAEFCVGK